MLTILLLLLLRKESSAMNEEFRLKEYLFKQYNPDVRPVKNSSDNLELFFDLAIQQIIDVNEKHESIVLSLFLRQAWKDEFIKWNPEDYGNITRINTKPENLWLPDMILYNNAEKGDNFGGSLDQMTSRLIIYHTGHVEWFSPAIVTGKCPMNIRKFPFDEQECHLKFGSYSYHGNHIDLKHKRDTIDLGSFSVNSEWNIIDTYYKRNVIKYGCCPDPYTDITVHITVKRKPLFYVLNLLLPMIFIGVLALLSFFLPAESGERISFAVTLMLALTVFMLIVADMIPASSETIPILGLYFTAVMVQMVLMVFTMSYTLNLHLRSPEESNRIGKWTRAIIYDYLAIKLRVRKSKLNEEGEMKIVNGHGNRMSNGHSNGHSNVFTICHTNGQVNGNAKTADFNVNSQHHIKASTTMDTATSKIMQENIDIVKEKMREDDLEKEIKREFEICARTFDVIALIFFGFMFILTLLVYLFCTGEDHGRYFNLEI